jgi:hypothetical protein
MYQRAALILLLPLAILQAGSDAGRDFSGKWILDAQHSDLRALPSPAAARFSITQQGSTIQCAEGSASWSFRTDGSESNYRVNGADMSTETKWEGSALLVSTLVSGAQNYATRERWHLSPDHATLTITRTIQRGGSEREATLVYINEDHPPVAPTPTPGWRKATAPPPPALTEFVIDAGTKIPLSMVNSLSTKHTAEGDHVYLETVFPVMQKGRIVIPKGSYVSGTVTEVKRGGAMKGKPQLFLRFDSLTLPNGVTRDFRARLDNSDAGSVDRQEGTITGDRDKSGDVRTVGQTTAAGAGIGGIAGVAAGHAGMGVGIGALGGAAAGLAGVLSRDHDLVLPKGTTVEMVLDRPLHYEPRELVR